MALVNRVARPLSLHKINAMSCVLWFTEVVWRLKFWLFGVDVTRYTVQAYQHLHTVGGYYMEY